MSENQYFENMKLEYSVLREEITQRINMRQQLLSFTLAISGVVIGLQLDNNSGQPVVLVLPPLLFFLALAWTHNDIRIDDIATYIRNYIEPKLHGLNWETTLQVERREPHKFRFRRAILSHGGLFVIIQGISIAIYGASKMSSSNQNAQNKANMAFMIVDIVFIISTVLSFILNRRQFNRRGKIPRKNTIIQMEGDMSDTEADTP